MNRRTMFSTVAAGALSLAIVPVASGAAEWCEDDPLVEIKTPTGYVLPVHVTNYAKGNHKEALKIVHNNPLPPYITYTVDPITSKGKAKGKPASGTQSWDVSIWVLIPGQPIAGDAVEGKFQTKTVASTGEYATGEILARAQGWSDDLMQLRFTITA